MKFVFHAADFTKPFGVVCSILTSGPWSHGSFITNSGNHYDTTASRGFLGVRVPQPNRRCVVYDVPEFVLTDEDLSPFIGTKYDLLGLLFYPWGAQDGSKLFCFESQVVAAKLAGLKMDIGKPSPLKMIQILEKMTTGVLMKETDLMDGETF